MLTRLGLVSALLVGLMAAAQPATAAPQNQTGNTGSIAGKVTAADTGQPLGGIVVSACPNDGTGCFVTYPTTTFADGTYVISSVPTGQYWVSFNPWAINDFLNSSTLVTVTANTQTSNVNAALLRGGAITGKVTLLAPFTGNPLLRLYRLDFPPEVAGFPIQSLTLQGSGEYTFNRLAQSDAYIVQLTIAGYPDQYYNSQWSRTRANVIRVTAGMTTTQIDFTLNVLGSITGQITSSASGQPIHGINVTANGPSGAFYTTTDPSGTYQFDGLPLGQYRLSFNETASPPRYQYRTYDQPGPDPFSPNVVTLDSANPARVVNLSLKPTGQVDVKLMTEDGGDPDRLVAGIELPWCYSSFLLRSEITGTTQTIMGVPDGRRRVFVFPIPIISGLGKTDYYADAVNVNVQAPAIATTTILLKRGGSIAGFVVNEAGAGLSGVPVRVRGPASEAGYALTYYDGSFAMQGLPPSTYTLTVNSENSASEYVTATVANVTVSAAQTQTLSNIVLRKGSKISGSVKGTTYTPSRAQVELLDNNNTVVANTEAKNETYAFQGVAPGSYRVRFNGMWPAGMWSNALNLNPYMAQYYEGQTLSSTATLINIPTTPITLTNINAVLQPGGRIAGAVLDAFGIAMAGVRVLVYDATYTVVSKAITGIDGSYITSPGLPAGQYKVRFDYTACNGRPVATAFYKTGNLTAQGVQSVNGLAASFDDATPVNVVLGQTTHGIDAALVPDGFSVSGRVTDKGNAVPNFKLVLNNGNEATTDAGGYYTFTAIYTGALTLAPAAGMSATTPASRNIVVGPNAVHQDFSISAVAATFSIGGRVLRNGIGVASFKLNISNGTQVTTDANGDYSVANLSAGTYTITPATGQLPVAPASRAITVPPNAGNSDFSIFQVMTPLVVR